MKKLIRSLWKKVLLIGIGAASTLLAVSIMGMPRWEFWDRFMKPEPINIPVMLSTKLKYDDSGVYTGEIRRALGQTGFKYRIIDRTFPKQGTIVTSAERTENIRNQAKRILENHGGDVLIYGAVGAEKNAIWVQFFGQGPDGYMEHGIKVDIDDGSWIKDLTHIVEAMATESGLHQFLGEKVADAGVSLEEFLDATENKLSELNNVTESAFLKERTNLGIEMVRVARAKTENDIETIRKIRNSMEEQVGKEYRIDESDYQKIRRLKLADLYMIEGLMEGNPGKIEEGMKIAIDAGVTMLEAAMRGDKTTVQNPENATFPDWLLMTILVLACGDEEVMKRLELLLLEKYDRIVENQCMADSDAIRMLLPLAVLSGKRDQVELEHFRDLLGQFRDFGLGKIDHWQDPFLHARRLVTKRLTSIQNLENPEGRQVETYCPSLKRFMEMKGWFQPVRQGQSRSSSPVGE